MVCCECRWIDGIVWVALKMVSVDLVNRTQSHTCRCNLQRDRQQQQQQQQQGDNAQVNACQPAAIATRRRSRFVVG
jgi:hypothetical protein